MVVGLNIRLQPLRLRVRDKKETEEWSRSERQKSLQMLITEQVRVRFCNQLC